MDDGPVGSLGGVESRRRFLRQAALAAVGTGLGIVGCGEVMNWADRKGARNAGVATRAGGPQGMTGWGGVQVVWGIETDEPVLALTFDDGPRSNWTTMVLDVLEKYETPATFFMVGERVRGNADVIRGRMGRHEIGNHTWDHQDLSKVDYRRAKRQLARTHEAIVDVVGVEPRLFRPPYGHLGGAAMLAAAEMSYQAVLWSHKMREATFDTKEQVAAVLRETVPGTILLAHDVGRRDRLVALRGLPAMITGLRRRGFEFVTVSQAMRRAERVSSVVANA